MRRITRIAIAATSVLLVISALLLPNIALAEQAVFMRVVGETSGAISDGAGTIDSVGIRYIENHENEIYCTSFGHTITTPYNPKTGIPSGGQLHGPVFVSKYFDRSSPQLFLALASGETLSQVVLKFHRTTMEGSQEHFFTVELIEAKVVEIKPSSGQGFESQMEEINFTYKTIKYTDVLSGHEFSDNWK